MEKKIGIESLFSIIKELRGENGCPWDKKQTPSNIANYLTEESFELAEAVESEDDKGICEELGDVLFQILILADMFEEKGCFNFEDVCSKTSEKMIRRHPHVFGDKKANNPQEAFDFWLESKKAEKSDEIKVSAIDSVPKKLPALMRAYKISERAAKTGFDWKDIQGAVEKAEEEWVEFKEEIEKDDSYENKEMEFGDVLFTMINVARFARVHPETALTKAVIKFEKRFKYMEELILKAQKNLETMDLEEFESFWQEAKKGKENGN